MFFSCKCSYYNAKKNFNLKFHRPTYGLGLTCGYKGIKVAH